MRRCFYDILKPRGEILFASSDFGVLLGEIGDQVQARCDELALTVAENQPHLKNELERIRGERREAGERIEAARREKVDLEERMARLNKGKGLENAMRGSVGLLDVTKAMAGQYERGIADVDAAIVQSIAAVNRQIGEEELKVVNAKKEKAEALAGVIPTVRTELGKRGPYKGLKDKWGGMERNLDQIQRTREGLVLHNAGLLAATERVIEQAGAAKPIKAFLEEDIGLMEEVQTAADREERRLARNLDEKLWEEIAEGRRGDLEETVVGMQDRREIGRSEGARQLVDTLHNRLHEGFETYLEVAVIRASDQVRELIEERPGFLKRPIGDELLTVDNLVRHERESEERMDLFHKFAVKAVRRSLGIHSVDVTLGCRVEVEGEGKERKLDFSTKAEARRGKGVETSLFVRLVDCEQVEAQLRRDLSETEPANIERVRVLTAALTENDRKRASILKNIGSRINGFFVADGVRGGELKVKAVGTGVKLAEAGLVIAGAVLATRVAIGLEVGAAERVKMLTELRVAPLATELTKALTKIAEARTYLAGVDVSWMPDALKDIGKMDIGPLREALKGDNVARIQELAATAGDQVSKVSGELFRIVGATNDIQEFIPIAEQLPGQIQTLQAAGAGEVMEHAQIAQTALKVGTIAGGVATFATLCDGIRGLALKGIRGATKRLRG